jgi:hypothetical protein
MAETTTPWDAGYCVNRFKAEAGLQDANELDEEDDICPALSRGQSTVFQLIAQRYPKALYQAPKAMIPSADGTTFRYGDDQNGNAIVAMGYVQIAPRLSAFSGDRAFVGWREDIDFLDEGDRIRIPSGRSYAGPLYARFVPTPPVISIDTQTDPILKPADARELIVIQAVKEWAGEGNQRPDLVQGMKTKWADKFPSWMLTFRTRFRNGGALYDPARWYFAAPDLGNTGS